jgi:1-aminocyclopropane-1-carboxylate deaminase/D-cysteine desulfhydrase-like pyridoxal-dependent ACC family enzyme
MYIAFLLSKNQNTLRVTDCHRMLSYTQTPIQEIIDPVLTGSGVRLLIKREELNHMYCSGNKWWKLKYNMGEACKQGKTSILTFGGAYSNHIYATAFAADQFGLRSIGVIRGEESLPLNSTLSFATQHHMSLQYISRDSYRRKDDPNLIIDLKKKWGDPYILPEGGSNELAIEGVREFAGTLITHAFDFLCSPVGTGGTLAGLILGMGDSRHLIGFPAVKGSESIENDIRRFLSLWSSNPLPSWHLETSYHMGGYGKITKVLIDFIERFETVNGIRLDPLYTGKMMFGIFDLIRQGKFPKGSTIMAIHTGGLQGWGGMLERHGTAFTTRRKGFCN